MQNGRPNEVYGLPRPWFSISRLVVLVSGGSASYFWLPVMKCSIVTIAPSTPTTVAAPSAQDAGSAPSIPAMAEPIPVRNATAAATLLAGIRIVIIVLLGSAAPQRWRSERPGSEPRGRRHHGR